MTPAIFREMSKEIKEVILATDLAAYFRSRTKLIPIMHENAFDWDNIGHRSLLKSLMITACDLSGQCKVYNVAKKITDYLYSKLEDKCNKKNLLFFVSRVYSFCTPLLT